MQFTLTTHGITIIASPRYEGEASVNGILNHIFSYDISIQNNTQFDVQLLSRRWKIFDSYGEESFVEGDGVVGEQPIINPNEIYKYSSWCPIVSGIGFMEGSYKLKNLHTNENFDVRIPRFELCATWYKN